jgi:hypothetical protein
MILVDSQDFEVEKNHNYKWKSNLYWNLKKVEIWKESLYFIWKLHDNDKENKQICVQYQIAISLPIIFNETSADV